MKKTNKFGFISGGYIFDQLDRLALSLVESKSKEKYNFTRWGFCLFDKQLCNEKDFYLGFSYCKKIPFTKTYITKVYMKNKKRKALYFPLLL